jgi:hypothetical protein
MTKSLDLARLLPKRYRDKTIDTLLGNLFDPHLSKPDSETFHGYIGQPSNLPSDIYLDEADLERQINQLAPALYVKAATEEDITSWSDLVQRMNLLGISYSSLADWFNVGAHNFTPPISLDKFTNYPEYLWIGPWLKQDSTLPYQDIGVPAAMALAALTRFNPAIINPDYYVVQRSALVGTTPVAPYVGAPTWSDWALGNLWIHKDEAIAFYKSHPTLSINSLKAATRPIIEIQAGVQLNLYSGLSGQPSDEGIIRPQVKTGVNQPVQIDLYYHNGTHAALSSAGFFYQESSEAAIDPVLGRRVVTKGKDFIFAHGFIHPDNGRLLWFKNSVNGSVKLNNMWSLEGGQSFIEKVEYKRYSSVGTILNLDKLLNYQDYFWTDITTPAQYNVIASGGGTSDWTIQNHWSHVSTLRFEQQQAASPAVRPIIEFNSQLNSQLLSTIKASAHELPRFKIYASLAGSSVYPAYSADFSIRDGYTNGMLFARLADIDPDLQTTILSSAELSSRLLTSVKGEAYVQSLANGLYRTAKDGIAYGFISREAVRTTVGNGQLSIAINPNPNITIQRVLKLVASSSTAFVITTCIGETLGTLTIGAPLTINGVTLNLLAGLAPFTVGDKIVIEIKSVAYERISLFVKLGDEYKSFTSADNFLTDGVARKLVPADISLQNGAWAVHKALSQNLNSENPASFAQADLIGHFTSIIAAQPGLQGNAFGRNTYRQLTKNYSLGGKIKQLDQRLALFLSTLLQPGTTPVTLLDVSKRAYDEMLGKIQEYVEEKFIDDIITGAARIPTALGTESDSSTISSLVAYLTGAVTDSLGVGQPYFDTSMPIKALTLTAPYLGITTPVEPALVFDQELNLNVIRHHDGHQSKVRALDDGILKRLVQRLFKRSSGQVTPGIISGPNPPQLPFAKQLWLDLSTMSLYIYDVLGDLGEQPATAALNSFSYNQSSGEVFKFTGSWISLGSTQAVLDARWTKLDLSKALSQLTLSIEKQLYERCPSALLLNTAALSSSARFKPLMKKEFERFASAHGILDPYNPGYEASNPFTWNYTSASTVDATAAAWQEIYKAEYGTARPDLQPWLATGYATESQWLAVLITATLLPSGTVAFVPSTMWSRVASKVKADLITLGKPISNPGRLSVNIATGALLPPFALGLTEQLFNAAPPTPNAQFLFGQVGAAERTWLRSTDYLLALGRSYYRIDPLTFTSALWGDDLTEVNHYKLLERTGLKATIKDVLIHGQPLAPTAINEPFVSNLAYAAPAAIAIRIVRTNTLAISVNGISKTVAINPLTRVTSYVDGALSFTLTRPLTGFKVGSNAIVNVDALGVITLTHGYPSFSTSSGLGQLLIHAYRRQAIDVQLTQALARLTLWEPRLTYRFGALVDSSALKLKVGDEPVTAANVKVLLDEVKHKSSQWYSALKVTLYRRGATERAGNIMVPALAAASGRRGDDWVFRVDVLNKQGPGIEWYNYAVPIELETFIALGGKNTIDEWVRPTNPTTISVSKGPFAVTGIQNLIAFLFGYADRQAQLGFVAGGVDEPILDQASGKKADWQFLIEQLVDKQFTGVNEGSSAILNPFVRELSFKAEKGVVSSFADIIQDESLTPMLLSSSGSRIPAGKFRIFRQDQLTTGNFDVDVYGIHVMTSIYEHVLVLPYKDGDKHLFSPTLGEYVSRLFVTGERQQEKHGRLSFGGKFLKGHDMSENLEASVLALRNLFDSKTLTANNPRSDRIRAMLGFNASDYFAAIGVSPASEFRFWQGLLFSKGTNSALDAYINSRQYATAYIDEYWAYKIATYGDGRPVIDVDLKVTVEDFTGEYANYLLIEDEVSLNPIHYADPFDSNAAISIRSDDASRWYSYGDTGQLKYFEATKVSEITLNINALGKLFKLRDKTNQLVRADFIEVVGADGTVYREEGSYSTTTGLYATPAFRRVTHSAIVIDKAELNNTTIVVRCYTPAQNQFAPCKLTRYRPDATTIVDDIIWWDPARGSHHPEAIAHVNYLLNRDPARYTNSNLSAEGVTLAPRSCWGNEQVGRVWWDMSKTAWLPYSDVKIYPDLAQRLAAWGGIAEHAELRLYEWVQASVPPLGYAGLVAAGSATGEAGFSRNIYRDRIWNQRPVVWLYSQNPQQTARQALAYQTVRLVETMINGLPYIASWQGIMPTQLKSSVKLAAATYSTTNRYPSEFTAPTGQLKITADQVTFMLGSATSVAAVAFAAITSFQNVSIGLIDSTLRGLRAARGILTLDSETDGGVLYARASFLDSGLTQRVAIPDTPVKINTPYEIVFDLLGIKVSSKAIVASIAKTAVAAELFNLAHSIVLREALPIDPQIPTGLSFLAGAADTGTAGWVAWTDPLSLGTDNFAPLNGYQAVVGAWVKVDTRLAGLVSDIKDRLTNPWTLRDGSVIEQYQAVFSRWKAIAELSNENVFDPFNGSITQFARSLGFAANTLPDTGLVNARVYVNGRRILNTAPVVDTPLYMSLPSTLALGDTVKVIVPGHVPTSLELTTDLTLPTANPSLLREYRLDAPYTKEEVRNEQGRVTDTKYYYWVSGKQDQALNKSMPTARAEQLLRNHDGSYAVPQIRKLFNQLDGRPNRYAMLCFKGLSKYVGANDSYKLRIKRDLGMRSSAENNTLKVRHSEWTLIRPNQATRIPVELWNKLTDTLCGKTLLGETLPYTYLSRYDAQSKVKSSYGIGDGQVLTDSVEAIATVLGTMSNTRVLKFDQAVEMLVPYPISYIGFTLARARQSFKTAAGIRLLMGEIWVNASPKQINELFFAVLEDSLVKTTELAGIFKTSFIALGEVHTVLETATPADISGLVTRPPVIAAQGAIDALGIAEVIRAATVKNNIEPIAFIEVTRLITGKSNIDALPFIETSSFSTIKPLADSFSFIETSRRSATKNILESLPISETVYDVDSTTLMESIASVELVRLKPSKTLSDAFAFTEIVKRTTTKALVESLAAIESIRYSSAKPVAESFLFAETSNRAVVKNNVEPIGLAEVTTRAVVKNNVEPLSLVEVISRASTKPISETFVFTEAAMRAVVKNNVEPLSLVEVISRASTKPVSETFVFTEISKRAVVKNNVEPLSLVEVISRASTKPVSETFVFTEISKRAVVKNNVEPLSLVEVISRASTKPISETFVFTEISKRAVVKNNVEPLSLVEVISRASTKPNVEPLSLVEVISRASTKPNVEPLSLVEVISRASTKPNVEPLSLVELIKRTTVKNISESLPISETFYDSDNRALMESMAFTEAVQRASTKPVSETFVFVETIQRSTVKATTDSFVFTESSASTSTKPLAEALSLVESVSYSFIPPTGINNSALNILTLG